MKYGLLSIMVLLLFACEAGQGIMPEERTRPIEITIIKSVQKVYQTAGEILSEYGFPIINSDQSLGIISTDFINYDAGSLGLLGAMVGMKDFMIQINIKITRIDDISSVLKLTGKMKHIESENIFRNTEKIDPIGAGSESYKQMQKIAKEIKFRAEAT